MSHLLQMRGLKLPTRSYILNLIVASFTDAWIETFIHGEKQLEYLVASFTDAWIETCGEPLKWDATLSRIFYRCVD